MLNVEFIGGDTIAAVLKAYSDGVQSAVEKSIGRSVLKLQREVMQNRLSGQVLNVRTGNLRRSIHHQVTSSDGLVVGEVNTNVRYGVAHETPGRPITWTGGFYFRVRFTSDTVDFENFIGHLWNAKKIEFTSLKL